MSRALCIDAPEAHVLATCAKRDVAISAIESLRSGGTRVVMRNADDAAAIGRLYGKKVITGVVTRTPLRIRAQ
jgi:hypothetical protein